LFSKIKPIKKVKEKKEINKTIKAMLVTNGKDAFLLLDKVRKEKKMSVRQICAKIGVSEGQYYRWCSDFKSQNSATPKFDKLSKISSALGYEFRIVEKKSEDG
jgi:DNA-binding phage protein